MCSHSPQKNRVFTGAGGGRQPRSAGYPPGREGGQAGQGQKGREAGGQGRFSEIFFGRLPECLNPGAGWRDSRQR